MLAFAVGVFSYERVNTNSKKNNRKEEKGRLLPAGHEQKEAVMESVSSSTPTSTHTLYGAGWVPRH